MAHPKIDLGNLLASIKVLFTMEGTRKTQNDLDARPIIQGPSTPSEFLSKQMRIQLNDLLYLESDNESPYYISWDIMFHTSKDMISHVDYIFQIKTDSDVFFRQLVDCSFIIKEKKSVKLDNGTIRNWILFNSFFNGLPKQYENDRIIFFYDSTKALTTNYKSYINSNQWKEVRHRILNRDGLKCFVCENTHDLQVHHRTYDRLGIEDDEDLITLCKNCHSKLHGK